MDTWLINSWFYWRLSHRKSGIAQSSSYDSLHRRHRRDACISANHGTTSFRTQPEADYDIPCSEKRRNALPRRRSRDAHRLIRDSRSSTGNVLVAGLARIHHSLLLRSVQSRRGQIWKTQKNWRSTGFCYCSDNKRIYRSIDYMTV